MRLRWAAIPALAAVSFGACATVPAGPSVMVLPGQAKSFEQFQVDDNACRQWAAQQSGIDPGGAATKSTVTGATVGTLVGAGLGAAIGAAAGNPGLGAAVGAGTGLFGGTAVGASAGEASRGSVQQRYDHAYQQCMYAKGNQIPAGLGSSRQNYAPPPPPPPPPPASAPSATPSATPASTGAIPPPPPGPPPPPPPSVR